MYLFLIPLLSGFAFAGVSVFTAAYSRWWGEKRGQMATSVLRNFLGIPLWLFGLILAWLNPAPLLFTTNNKMIILNGLFIIIGMVLVVWGHIVLGWRTHMPSIKDTLVSYEQKKKGTVLIK